MKLVHGNGVRCLPVTHLDFLLIMILSNSTAFELTCRPLNGEMLYVWKKIIPTNFGWKSKDGTLIPIMHTTHALLDKQSFSNVNKYHEYGSEEYWTDSSDVWSDEADELP